VDLGLPGIGGIVEVVIGIVDPDINIGGDLQQAAPDFFAVGGGPLASADNAESAEQEGGHIQVDNATGTGADGHNTGAPAGSFEGVEHGFAANQIQHHIV